MLVLLDVDEHRYSSALSKGADAVGAMLERWSTTKRTFDGNAPCLVVSDAEPATLMQRAFDLTSMGMDPRRLLVRGVREPMKARVYHDIPAFATVTLPDTAEDAADMLRRLIFATSACATGLAADGAGNEMSGSALAKGDPSYERLVEIAGRSDVKVTLIGETGTGKNTVARRIHALSGRSGRFVTLNCAALPEALIESELFGVEPGAYTGAVRSRPGVFEQADLGTLFLDEIDSMPIHVQAKLLGAIQDSGCTRLGDHRFRGSNFRLITASHQPLENLVNEGRFRKDLMYRLAVLEIHLPTVRSLGAGLIQLFEDLIAQECERLGLVPTPLNLSLQAQVLTHPWPGNFRELAAAAQRHALGLPILGNRISSEAAGKGLREQLTSIERELIRRAVIGARGSIREAARQLDLPVETLRYRMSSRGLTPEALDRELKSLNSQSR